MTFDDDDDYGGFYDDAPCGGETGGLNHMIGYSGIQMKALYCFLQSNVDDLHKAGLSLNAVERLINAVAEGTEC